MKHLILALLVFLLPALAASAEARIWTVRPDGTGDVPTIQSGIDAASAGDIVELADGTYTGAGNRDVDFSGKALIVRSESGQPANCVVDCQGTEVEPHTGFKFINNEGPGSILEGITITNGRTPDIDGLSAGGGIRCDGSPTIRNCIISNNWAAYGGGIAAGGSPLVENCHIFGNHGDEGGGIYCHTSEIVVSGCILESNYRSAIWSHESGPLITNCTLINNDDQFGGGSVMLREDSQLTMQNTIIAFNLRASIRCSGGSVATLTCCDLFGNEGYDWDSCFEDQLGVDGNIQEDPLFCDFDAGDYALTTESPCSPLNNPSCGLIGAGPDRCVGSRVWVSDLLWDQGGAVVVTWERFRPDDPQHPTPILEYDVQRDESEWITLETVPAIQTVSYAAIVATDDILVLGEPEPISNYRVVGRTADPDMFFESPETGGYSIDNIPPPAPEIVLHDDTDFRAIIWEYPEIEDFGETCIYRGEESGFEPDTPVSCTDGRIYVEDLLKRFYYVARFKDIHGNLGASSNEVIGQFPTGFEVPGSATARLLAGYPNPFNAGTVIGYSLRKEGFVRLAIYELTGRHVLTLVEGRVPAGDHEVTWNGRDDHGRSVASASYLCRLETNGYSKTRRLVFLK